MREVPPAVKRMMDKYGKEFKYIFDVEINKFAGKLCYFGIPSFDIVEFNKFMKRKGYNEYNDGSLADYVKVIYGERGSELIDKLLGLEIENDNK